MRATGVGLFPVNQARLDERGSKETDDTDAAIER